VGAESLELPTFAL